eukprot:CAMPEP_0174279978 /NCGR_PEP_ID=MMETSP0809-20121228/273_1 /TAXON_ID=73025 ORGANISM="Eutreptiella gymnastica-like, Strain CCMP1594" /NCGR_SAMPLE_ID=MMETSP0809 /ASSEMBLY_ACC=CAM_ASM_000658 /LENGTH=82 /DNA_ID=CAMNT_0015372633 /DNA_START=102 /DNA_END=346 /DNA_ORIENTATION=+
MASQAVPCRLRTPPHGSDQGASNGEVQATAETLPAAAPCQPLYPNATAGDCGMQTPAARVQEAEGSYSVRAGTPAGDCGMQT